jgi:hypothetical protein
MWKSIENKKTLKRDIERGLPRPLFGGTATIFERYISALEQAGVHRDDEAITTRHAAIKTRRAEGKVQDGPFAEIKEQLRA